MNNQINHLIQLAITYLNNNNLSLAKKVSIEALKIQPKNFHALHIIGLIHGLESNHIEAVKFLLMAVKINPNDYHVNFNLAKALSETGKNVDAIKYHISATKLDPKNPVARLNYAKTLFQLNQVDESIANLDKALNLNPSYFEAWLDKAHIFHKLERYDESLVCFDKAICLNPNLYEAWLNKGRIFHKHKQYDEALAHYDEVIRIHPNFSEVWANKGNLLHELKRYEDALLHYEKAIELKPDYVEALTDKGLSLYYLERYDEAIANYDAAIEINPEYAEAHWNKSHTMLLLGKFKSGWDLYESRWKRRQTWPYRHASITQLDSLDNINGKKILIWYEQGYGDIIQFSRLVTETIRLGANITFEIPKSLLSLFQNQFNCELCTSVNQKSKFDYQVPLLTLPNLLKIDFDNIPCPVNFRINTSEIQEWKEKLSLSNKKLNIGLAISGNINHENDSNRSISLSNFIPWLDSANFYLVQKDLKKSDEEIARHHNITVLSEQIHDFLDTASIITNLDLIISVDTSLIHLAGSLNKKSYLLVSTPPDWRWLLNSSTSPWYPSVKIFRKKNNDWGTVIGEIMRNLNIEK